jgi:hypothetical protein
MASGRAILDNTPELDCDRGVRSSAGVSDRGSPAPEKTGGRFTGGNEGNEGRSENTQSIYLIQADFYSVFPSFPSFPPVNSPRQAFALTFDGVGLDNYGECSMILKEAMIAHRASVFEENSVQFMDRHQIRVADANAIPRGYSAPWEDRNQLCTAKSAAGITRETRPEDHPGLLLAQGKTSEDEIYVEVHIFGPMTVRTFEKVVIRSGGKAGARESILDALRERLQKADVPLEIV